MGACGAAVADAAQRNRYGIRDPYLPCADREVDARTERQPARQCAARGQHGRDQLMALPRTRQDRRAHPARPSRARLAALVRWHGELGRSLRRSAAYYAHGGNRFWRALHETGITPAAVRATRVSTDARSRRRPHGLLQDGLGRGTRRSRAKAFDVAGFRRKVAKLKPAALAFTSKTSASLWLGKSTGRIDVGRQVTARRSCSACYCPGRQDWRRPTGHSPLGKRPQRFCTTRPHRATEPRSRR